MTSERQVIETTAGEAAAELSRRGIAPAERVTITIAAEPEAPPARQTLTAVAAKMQATARQRGLTTEIFDGLLAKP